MSAMALVTSVTTRLWHCLAIMLDMQHELNDTTRLRGFFVVAFGLAGAYVGAVLFFVTLGLIDSFVHPQGIESPWTRQNRSDLFLYSFVGIIVLSWWIVPVSAFFGDYFIPKLSQWPRKTAMIRGILLGAALGLLTAASFALVAQGAPTRTIHLSFAFL